MKAGWPAVLRPLLVSGALGIAAAGAGWVVAAQQPRAGAAPGVVPAAEPEPTARIVRLDAVVTDRNGRPISNLKAADFEIIEDGVAQRVDAAVQPNASRSPGGGPDGGAILSREDEERAARTPGTRVVALLLDEFHVGAGAASARVRETAWRFVETQLRPHDLLAVLKPLDSLTNIRFDRDREAARRAIESFGGRRGDYAALTEFEEKYIGRAPDAVQPARRQIVLAGLRALTMRLGELQAGRAAVVLVTEGFVGDERRERERRVPDVQGLIRAASRHNVAIYGFNPGETAGNGSEASTSLLQTLAAETGGDAVLDGGSLAAGFERVIRDLDSYYLLSYTSSHPADGRFYDVQVRAKPATATVRTRPGYWAPLRSELLRPMDARPAAPVRALKRSPLVDTWLGLTVNAAGRQEVVFTWEPAALPPRARASSRPSVVGLKVTTKGGAVLFEGELRAPRSSPGLGRPEAAVFEADPGVIQLDLIVLGADGSRLDTAAHDLEVPDANRADPLILPPQVFTSSSAKEFREISGDRAAAPVPGRRFRRTERLLLRVPVHSPSGAATELAARLLNRAGHPLRDLAPMPRDPAVGVAQYDLPLSWLAPGEYTVELTARSSAGSAKEVVRIRVTG